MQPDPTSPDANEDETRDIQWPAEDATGPAGPGKDWRDTLIAQLRSDVESLVSHSASLCGSIKLNADRADAAIRAKEEAERKRGRMEAKYMKADQTAITYSVDNGRLRTLLDRAESALAAAQAEAGRYRDALERIAVGLSAAGSSDIARAAIGEGESNG